MPRGRDEARGMPLPRGIPRAGPFGFVTATATATARSPPGHPSRPPSRGDCPHPHRLLSALDDNPDNHDLPIELRVSSYLSTHTDTTPKQKLANCSACHGCNTILTAMASESKFLDRTFTNEKGATPGWTFRAKTNRTPEGIAVTKGYCMPISKRTVLRGIRLQLALQKLSDECGFEDIVPRVWSDKVDAVVPGQGYHIRWHGLWMEYVNGVSLENYLHKGQPKRFSPPEVMEMMMNKLNGTQGQPKRFSPPEIMEMMMNKLNGTQVVLAAIFDLLTSQCDRHPQNIFISEQGQVKLVDNEVALQSRWGSCGFDSILIPGTQKNEIVLKLVTPANVKKGVASPELLMDYRCYLPEGSQSQLGIQYPPRVAQCLKNIAAMSADKVQEHYGFMDLKPARNLLTRAQDMINPERGFEWAYKYGDPTTGREWKKPRPDTGSFVGGTTHEEEKA
eukprot:gene12582-15806_t